MKKLQPLLIAFFCLLIHVSNAARSESAFTDVPPNYWAFSFIETLVANGITSGCDATHYCPDDSVTRAQMAIFLERGMRGSDYNPGPGSGNIFLDVAAGYWAVGWIEQLYMDGITSGCGVNRYCPASSTTRAEMAIFLLRAKYGQDYAPPTPVGMFNDVPASHWAAGWIERLAAEGITSGCGVGKYCPNSSVTRAEMAVFLVRTFGLTCNGCDIVNTSHRAILGPLADSSVNVFSLSERDNLIVSAITDVNGAFDLGDVNLIDDDYYLISVTGGEDTDADDDGNIDSTPTNNKGTIYGLVSGGDLKNHVINITAISDIAWRYIESSISTMSINDIRRRLSDIATILFASDITGDDVIDEVELFSFDPQDASHKRSLNFDYEALFSKDSEGDSIINAYHNNKEEKLKILLESRFGSRLSFYTPKDSRSEYVKVEVIPFGRGSFISDSGDIDFDADRDVDDNKAFAFYTKSDSSITITAIPKSDTEILGWGGCDSVSSDNTRCQVSLFSDHQITISFGYKETLVVDNLVDLSRAYVSLDGGSKIYVTINHGDDELVEKMNNLSVDDYVVGGAGDGFLRKVTLITRISDFKYTLESVGASLEEVILQGTGVFTKVMTNEDIDSGQFTSQQNIATTSASDIVPPGSPGDDRKQEVASFSAIEGVELIRPSNLRDDTFTIRLGAPDSPKNAGVGTSALTDGITEGIEGTVVLLKDEQGVDILRAKGEVKISLKLDVGIAIGGIFPPRLEYFKLIGEGFAEEKLEIFAGKEFDIENFCPKDSSGKPTSCLEAKIATLPFTKITFLIGPVPVYLVPELGVYVGVDGKVTAKITTGIELKEQLRAGFVFNDSIDGLLSSKSWNMVGELPYPSMEFVPPTAEASIEAKFYIQPSLAIRLYGIAGPVVPVRGYLKAKTELLSLNPNVDEYVWINDWCNDGFYTTAWAGISAEVKLDFDIDAGDSKLGKSLFDGLVNLEKSKLFFQNEWLLRSWQFGGTCDDSNVSPRLKVTGDHIWETITAFSDEKTVKEFVLSNIGGTELDWQIEIVREDDVLSVSKLSGVIQPGESETVTVELNTSTIDVGEYVNRLKFINNDFGLIGDDVSGTTERNVSLTSIPGSVLPPVGFDAGLFSPTIVKLTWDYPENEKYIHLVKGYRIFQSTDQVNWESIAVINDVETKSHLVPNLLTGKEYYFLIGAFTDDINSETAETSIMVPNIEPVGDCRAYFTGGLLGDHQVPDWFSEVYVVDQYSEYVGAGLHPDNTQTFPKAVASTFDGIAIDAGTKVTLYSQKDFQGDILYEKIGPAIVNNVLYKDSPEARHAMEFWKEPLQSNYPQSVREWSNSDMHAWDTGSAIVECGY